MSLAQHPSDVSQAVPDLSVVIPSLHEGENLALLLPVLREVLDQSGIAAEILIVSAERDELTERAVAASAARLLIQHERGYGGALITGFAEARGGFVLTMDADLSHPAEFVRALWDRRDTAEVLIASRYVAGGRAEMPLRRFVLSKVLNRVFSRGLSLRIRDMSSGFRLFDARVVKGRTYTARDFDIIQELLVTVYAEGWRVAEVPFHYRPRRHGSSHARVLKFGLAYIRTFGSMWRLRNSIHCADYDDRAHDSVIPLQRYWRQARLNHAAELIAGQGAVLDVGCGSSPLLRMLPRGSAGVDSRLAKLRYARRHGRPVVQAREGRLPFADATFSCVIALQVLEHAAKNSGVLEELGRVLQPGGRLVLGTPDSARREWRAIKGLYRWIAPRGYRDEDRAEYSHHELCDLLTSRGYAVEATRYVLRSEMILAARKPGLNR